MPQMILTFAHGAMILLFGVYLSVSFAGIRLTKKNLLYCLGLCALCGGLQIVSYVVFTEQVVWKLYPFITHLPLALFLCIVYRKKVATTLVAVFTAYLCCQPAKWFGVLTFYLTESTAAEYLTRICVLAAVAFIVLKYLAPYLSQIFNKDTRSVCIFGIMPTVYYIFDYATVVYTDLWTSNNRVAAEFLPFFQGIVFMIFCFVYYKEYEQKADAERKEQIVRIAVEQQAKELEAVKRSEHETRLLRHDMRLLLDNLALSIEKDDKENSLKMISGFVSQVDAASLHRYCENDTINYILTNFKNKCCDLEIAYHVTVEIEALTTDEILFSSIVSNALDNALNAQKELPIAERQIKLMLKTSDEKLLLSVRNPFRKKPVFVDGLPVSGRKGHGYGTQSIRYMTERLGGKCQFIVQNNTFVLRVIL